MSGARVARAGAASAALLATLAAATAGPAGAGAKPARKVVRVLDDYFLPAKLTVRSGTRVVWRWPAISGDVHDVRLDKGPKGVRRFKSFPAATGYKFRRTLEVPGTYSVICSFHELMAMTIRVRR